MHILPYLLLESYYCHFDICMTCVYVISFLVHAPLFLSDADILITCDWVMVISGPYIFVSVSVSAYFILGYDVPVCGSRVPLYILVYVPLLFLFILLLMMMDIT